MNAYQIAKKIDEDAARLLLALATYKIRFLFKFADGQWLWSLSISGESTEVSRAAKALGIFHAATVRILNGYGLLEKTAEKHDRIDVVAAISPLGREVSALRHGLAKKGGESCA